MALSIGLGVLAFTALALALFLVAYTVFVRLRQATYTEKRFNFVALWSCAAVIFLAIHAIINIPIFEALLAEAGLSLTPPDTASKIMVAIIAIFYVWIVMRWANSWNGLVSEERYRADVQGASLFFALDGAKETLRIIRRETPSPVHQGGVSPTPELPPPISELTPREQVRDLIVGRWPELIIDDDSWIADGSCWFGQDTALEQPLLVLCGLNETEVQFDHLAELVARRAVNGRIRLIAVLDEFKNRAEFATAIKKLSESSVVYTFEELIVEALPLSRYRREIDRQFRENRLPGSDFAIADVIVPTQLYETVATGEKSAPLRPTGDLLDFESFVSKWLVDGSQRHLALLGTYGQGKSTAALALTHKLLHDQEFAARCDNRLPILIRLTGLSPKTSDPEGMLGQWGYKLGLNGRALLALHRAGRTVLIFDAFDEMANVADRADRFDHFSALWQFTSSGSKVIFTGRPNFFLDDEDLKRTLGISEGVTVGPYCSALLMAPFDSEQIAGTLRWLPSEKVVTFMRAIERLPQLLDIARRPSLLFQVSQLWHQGRIDIASEDVYSGTIVRDFVTYSLDRQIQKQRTEMASGRSDRQFIPLTLAELDYFTSGSAIAALSEGRNNSLPEPVFRATISHLLGALPEAGLPRAPGETGALAMPLKDRLADRPDATEACVQAVRTHGVIELDPAKAGMCKFSHKSFAEALAAEVLVCRALRLEGSPELLPDAIRPISLINQDAVFLFAMDIAAANRQRTEVQTGSEIFPRMLRTNRYFGRQIYNYIISGIIISDMSRAVVKKITKGRIRMRSARIKIDIPIQDQSKFLQSLFSRTAAILFFLSFNILAVGLFAAKQARRDGEDFVWDTSLIFLISTLFIVGIFLVIYKNNLTKKPEVFSFFLGPSFLSILIFSLALEYAMKTPTSDRRDHVLQFAILDEVVKRRVEYASRRFDAFVSADAGGSSRPSTAV